MYWYMKKSIWSLHVYNNQTDSETYRSWNLIFKIQSVEIVVSVTEWVIDTSLVAVAVVVVVVIILVIALVVLGPVVVVKALVWDGAVIDMSFKVLIIEVWTDSVVIKAVDAEVIDGEFAVTVSCSDVTVDMWVLAGAMGDVEFVPIPEQLTQCSWWEAFDCWPLDLLYCARRVLQAWMPSYHVWSSLALPAFPQFLNQEPPRPQQLFPPDFAMVLHLGHAELMVVVVVSTGVYI